MQFTTPSRGAGMQASSSSGSGMIVLSGGGGYLLTCLRSPDPTLTTFSSLLWPPIRPTLLVMKMRPLVSGLCS
jgi:hypothetical protein